MNGLTLRISKGGAKKSKSSHGFSALQTSSFLGEDLVAENPLFQEFVQATSVDDQLAALKSILHEVQESCNENTAHFLAALYFHAETKHPVKCFIARHITKSKILPPLFSKALASQITCGLQTYSHHKDYAIIVTKVAACIESFPAGINAVNMVDVPLAQYLKECLQCCIDALRQTTLSPTEKNEIFTLVHTTLRLLLHIIVNPNSHTLKSIFNELTVFLKQLLFDGDVPMDTKSVCGILLVGMRRVEFGADFWVDILEPKSIDEDLKALLSTDASQLALFSAVATSVSIDKLQTHIVILCAHILDIAERNPSESTFILGSTRTLVQLSKSLDKIMDSCIGLALMDQLLSFAWTHLDHYMDSVRHLTAQLLANVVRYCGRLKKQGNDAALNSLLSALTSLDKSRKSYYVSLTSLVVVLGASCVMELVAGVIQDVISVLGKQSVQASATTTLETLLQKHAQEADAVTLYRTWIEPVLSHVAARPLDCSVLNVLEGLLVKTVQLDRGVMEYILPHIKGPTDQRQCDLKCVLMLLNVARKCNALVSEDIDDADSKEWKGVIGYDVLKMAAIDAVDETRILSLTLIVESPKSTEPFTRGELDFVLYYLHYNLNAQSPNFRQISLSLVRKLLKRLEDSYQVLRRQKLASKCDYTLSFVTRLRDSCFESLIEGANFSRRNSALEILDSCDNMHLEGYQRIWKKDHVDKLLGCLEDSYEANKAMALLILKGCPVEMLEDETYSTSLDIEAILKQASSLKPTDCVSAAYKLCLLRTKLPDRCLLGEVPCVPERASFAQLRRLHTELVAQVALCDGNVVAGAGQAPMYGVIHCMGHILTRVDAQAIGPCREWSALVSAVVSLAYAASAAAAPVVNNSSPEGHMPNDGTTVDDHGNTSGVTLPDGRPVTAQMVLLCAWRTVKEVSYLLGSVAVRLSIEGEGGPVGTLTPTRVGEMGDFFTRLLAETKHRGAFEQAYVGFNRLLGRLWQCRLASLHALPMRWLTSLMAAIAASDRHPQLCATRRSAGLPFMIQALVTTELQMQGNTKCFHQCMATLLPLARAPQTFHVPESDSNSQQATDGRPVHTNGPVSVETRTHAINILRALFRNGSLDESVSGYVGEGLKVALQGFEGTTWMERNSSTLLFSALMVRVFGVPRSRDGDRLCARNRMTGRIFFLRYPALYDYMLMKLQEASSDADGQVLRPSLYPILLLLARLYPSSLEGTVSNLKLVAFVPLVTACARSGVLKTRQLAAKAMVPLVPPQRYLSHLEEMFKLICDVNIKRNYCHGILLQLIKLLEAKPDNLSIDCESHKLLADHLQNTQWILKQATSGVPCYLLTDEYVKVLNLIFMRFPSLIQRSYLNTILTCLKDILFGTPIPEITCGRDVCLSNCLYLYLVIHNQHKFSKPISDLVLASLRHKSYEVVLSAMNFMLILYGRLDLGIDSNFLEHLTMIRDSKVLEILIENQTYFESLYLVLGDTNKTKECAEKALRLLTLEQDTQKYIARKVSDFNDDEITDNVILDTIPGCIEHSPESRVHIYLHSLCNFVTKKLREGSTNLKQMLDILRVVYARSSSDNREETREEVVKFLETNYDGIKNIDLSGTSEEDRFEYRSTVAATLATLLQDDDSGLRQRVADIITRSSDTSAHSSSSTESVPRECQRVISSRAAELLLQSLRGDLAVLCVLALLDFRSEVCLTEEGDDEGRVFDQNERYNTFLEETVWTRSCAQIVKQRILQITLEATAVEFVLNRVLTSPYKKGTFRKLCGKHLTAFEDVVNGTCNAALVSPKVRMFVDMLSS